METETVEKLRALNRSFYNDFAEAFSDSRGASEPGLERVLAQVSPGDHVLDLGCGQGRLARLLPPSCSYMGIDSAEAMLRIAAREADHIDATFVIADLVTDAWEQRVQGQCDWVVLRAVLHHIPGYGDRLDVLRRAGSVLKDGGRVVIANWQFLRIERLRRRLLPWSTLGLTEEEVEPGDYLLDWQRSGHGIRYAHLIDETETQRLAREAGLGVEALFYADGHTNDLTLYAILSHG